MRTTYQALNSHLSSARTTVVGMENPAAVHEETPLLYESTPKAPKRTKLPRLQIALVLLVQCCEPLAGLSIFPYINQLITDLDIAGGDKRKVGYYAGLIESLFFVTQAATALQWGRISDRIGRKPVLILGLAGNALSVLSFGLSRSFGALVVSRCLLGLLNGNIGISMSVVSEVTDPTNRQEALALLPIVWGFATTVAPAVGGHLARPHERFPTIFGATFWRVFPYFLPCLAVATFISVSLLLVIFFFEETLPKGRKSATSQSLALTIGLPDGPKTLPLRRLLTYPVILSVANAFCLMFSEMAFIALLPLIMSTPVEYGGFGRSPSVIGSILATIGAYSALFQLLFSAKLVRWFGERRMFIVGTLISAMNSSFFYPMIRAAILRQVAGWVPWLLLGFALSIRVTAVLAFSCILAYINASSPGKNSLGATNGIAQTLLSVARAAGSAAATSIFAISLEKNILGGYAVYALLLAFSCVSLSLAVRLPHKTWNE